MLWLYRYSVLFYADEVGDFGNILASQLPQYRRDITVVLGVGQFDMITLTQKVKHN